MLTKVKIIPSVVNNQFLNANFIGNGEIFSTNTFSADPSLDANYSQLIFDFQIADNIDFIPESNFAQIQSLTISNDESFSSVCTINILGWPDISTPYDVTKEYICNLNTDYFSNPAGTFSPTFDTITPSDPSLAGKFVVNNWPLSGYGGSSAVYINVVLADLSGDVYGLPAGYGEYGYVLWEEQAPTTPGLPVLVPSNTYWNYEISEQYTAIPVVVNTVADVSYITAYLKVLPSTADGITNPTAYFTVQLRAAYSGAPGGTIIDTYGTTVAYGDLVAGYLPFVFSFPSTGLTLGDTYWLCLTWSASPVGGSIYLGVTDPNIPVFQSTSGSNSTWTQLIITPSFTGKQSSWKFNASTEATTGVYGTGISRYVADILEIRPDETLDNQLSLYSTIPGISETSRTLAPLSLATSFSKNDYTYNVGVYSSTSYTMGVAYSISSPSTGLALYADTLSLSTYRPSFGFQASLIFDVNFNSSGYGFLVSKIYVNTHDAPNNVSTPDNIEEVSVSLTFSNNNAVVVSLAQNNNTFVNIGTIDAKWNTLITSNCILEMYLTPTASVVNNETFGGLGPYPWMIVSAYLTSLETNESVLLTNQLMPVFTGTPSGWELGGATTAYVSSPATASFTCFEIAAASGRFLLDSDIGDCFGDIQSNSQFVTLTTPGTKLFDTNSSWLNVTEATEGGSASTTSNVLQVTTPNPSSVTPPALQSLLSEAVINEASSVFPTFSTHSKIILAATNDGNSDFYIAFSPVAVPLSSGRPMITRCDAADRIMDEPLDAPTVAVVFSALDNAVILVERSSDNTLTNKTICSFSPSTSTTASFTISTTGSVTISVASAVGLSVGQSIIINDGTHFVHYNITVVGSSTITATYAGIDSDSTSGTMASGAIVNQYSVEICGQINNDPPFVLVSQGTKTYKMFLTYSLDTNVSGQGYYYAFGVKSSDASPVNTSTHLSVLSVKVINLSQTGVFGHNDLKNMRHFFKGNLANANVQTILGQKLLHGQTDLASDINYNVVTPGNTCTLVSSVPTAGSTFIQRMSNIELDDYVTNVVPLLMELQIQGTANSTFIPYIQLWADISGSIRTTNGTVVDPHAPTYLPLTQASYMEDMPGYTATPDDSTDAGVIASMTAGYMDTPFIIQPDISDTYFTLYKPGAGNMAQWFWVQVTVPPGWSVGAANTLFNTGQFTEIFVDGDGNDIPGVTYNSSTGDYTPGTGWLVVDGLWHKLFAAYNKRHDNVVHDSRLQLRIRSESQAFWQSNPTPLSHEFCVDINPPSGLMFLPDTSFLPNFVFNNNNANRPFVTAYASTKNTQLIIGALDSDSDILCFRVGRETGYGDVIFDPWQSWVAFLNENNTQAEYVVYHYISNVLENNFEDPIGGRKIWVQIMDYCGNVSESLPITVFVNGSFIVDTKPPEGSLQFINPSNGELTFVQNTTNVILSIASEDSVSGVKDYRLRDLGQSPPLWSPWKPIATIDTHNFNLGDGFKNLEIQFRDYGNNCTQPSSVWSTVSNLTSTDTVSYSPVGLASGQPVIPLTLTLVPTQVAGTYNVYNNGTLFLLKSTDTFISLLNGSTNVAITANTIAVNNGQLLLTGASATSCVILRPTYLTIYSSVIQTKTYSDYVLQNSNDLAFPNNTAFIGLSNNPGENGRLLYFQDNDVVTITYSSVPVTNFTINSTYGYIVFDSPLPHPAGNYNVTVTRQTAQLYSYNGNQYTLVDDMGRFGENIITAMLNPAGSPYLFLGCGSGNIYKYDGMSISGPIYQTADGGTGLPITTLVSHQFNHETNPYIYAATGVKPRLFRASVGSAANTSSWNRVCATVLSGSNFLNNSSGNIMCAESALNMLFLGTDNASVLRYERILQSLSPMVESELLLSSNLDIGTDGDNMRPVSCLSQYIDPNSNTYVIAGSGIDSDIFTYSQTVQKLPVITREWNTQLFNSAFSSGIAPWQYYTYDYGYGTAGTSFADYSLTTGVFVAFPVTFNTLNEISNIGLMLKSIVGSGTITGTLAPFLYYDSGTGLAPSTSLIVGAANAINGITATTINVASLNQGYTETVVSFSSLMNKITLGVQYWVILQPTLTITGNAATYLGMIPGGLLQVNGGVWLPPQANNAFVYPTNNLLDNTITISDSINGSRNPIKLSSNALLFCDVGSDWEQTISNQLVLSNQLIYTLEFEIQANLLPSQATAIQILDGNHILNIYISTPSSNTVPTTNIVITNGSMSATASFQTPSSTMMNIRVGVNGQSVQVWAAGAPIPIINQPSFLVLTTTNISLKVGQIDSKPTTPWSWGAIRYSLGQIIQPSIPIVNDFVLSWHFPSAGSVRDIINYSDSSLNPSNTILAITDGIITQRRLDNPDDRMAKCFEYIPASDVWEPNIAPFNRINTIDGNFTGNGIVRVLSAIQYTDPLSGNLYVLAATQQGNIIYTI